MMDSPLPLVSVIIPVRDGARTILAQLGAVVDQQVDFPWELIVADNGSTDDTVAEVRRFQDGTPHDIRIVDASARRGPAAARNIAADEARGSILVFCDADDQAGAGWLLRMRAAIEDAAAACGGWEGDLLNRRSWRALSWTPTGEYRKDYLPDLLGGAANNMAVRADAFARVGGFDESMMTSEDMDLLLRIQLAGGTFVFVPDAVMHIRRRNGIVAVWRQAVSYGRGEFRLKHKYAKVIAAYDAERVASPRPQEDTAESPRARRRGPITLARRFIQNGGRLHLADRLWRVGLRRGEQSGAVDPAWTQIEPPPILPHH